MDAAFLKAASYSFARFIVITWLGSGCSHFAVFGVVIKCLHAVRRTAQDDVVLAWCVI
jgi:hypothetical protein